MALTHISYSQLQTYERCPRQWYLSKVAQAEERQTWYIPVGTAVHKMIEDWVDPDGPAPSFSAEDYLYPLIRKQMKIEPDLSKWMSGGPKDDPTIKDKCLQQVRDCFERALEVLEDFEVWEVEYDASGSLPGCEAEIKAYIDIVGEHKKHGPAILDWKTGMNKPSDAFQLETYRALLGREGRKYHELDKLPNKGFFVMLNPKSRKGALGSPIDLSQVNPGQIGARYQKAYEGMKARNYQANKGSACFSCFYRDSCLAASGPTPQALYYDKADKDGFPF